MWGWSSCRPATQLPAGAESAEAGLCSRAPRNIRGPQSSGPWDSAPFPGGHVRNQEKLLYYQQTSEK